MAYSKAPRWRRWAASPDAPEFARERGHGEGADLAPFYATVNRQPREIRETRETKKPGARAECWCCALLAPPGDSLPFLHFSDMLAGVVVFLPGFQGKDSAMSHELICDWLGLPPDS